MLNKYQVNTSSWKKMLKFTRQVVEADMRLSRVGAQSVNFTKTVSTALISTNDQLRNHTHSFMKKEQILIMYTSSKTLPYLPEINKG